jgi:hypothetical protein
MQRLAKTNRVPTTNPRGEWSSESLKATVDVVEKGITSLQGFSKFWGILVTSLFDHLYEKTKSKKIGPPGVLTKKEDEAIVTWVLSM